MPPLHQRVTVVLFSLTLCGLVLRTQLKEDDRWGFCMFRDLWTYQLSYRWKMSDGTFTGYDTAQDLRGDARQYMRTRSRDHTLGAGALLDTVEGIGAWAWANRRPAGAQALEVDIRRRWYGKGPAVRDHWRWDDESAP